MRPNLRSLLLCLLLTIPALAQDAAPDPYATLITIQKNGKITLRLDGRNRSVTRADLTAVLTAAGNPAGRTVYIKASPSLPFATVQDTLDRVKQAGIAKVEIVSTSHR